MLSQTTFGALFLSLITLLFLFYNIGFKQTESAKTFLFNSYKLLMVVFAALIIIRLIIETAYNKKTVRKDIFSLILLSITIFIVFDLSIRNFGFTLPSTYKYIISVLVLMYISLVEVSASVMKVLSKSINPSLIFIVSFLLIITIGTVLLLLPNSTHEGISFINALFTSTSATCVTGLVSVPFSETFTISGQLIVLALIQIGGLGVLTITTFFAVFFMSGISTNSEYVVKDIISGDRSTQLYSLVGKIVITTLVFEFTGALLIYIYCGPFLDMAEIEKIYFAIFHSISAFCNAGFSTMPNNLAEQSLIHIYPLYLIVSLLIITGGIGFPIISNMLGILKHRSKQFISLITKKKIKRFVREWDINSIIVIKTTGVLLLTGTFYFLIFEWNGLLAPFEGFEKISQAFFNSVTPRTAGFNSLDTSSLGGISFFVILILMWIGGAPQSTSGGIKVTTFTLMIKNAVEFIKGNPMVEISGREISNRSITKAFATVVVSLITIFLAHVTLITIQPEADYSKLLFEIVSALGTVGLSMGITGDLNEGSKIVIIILMFVGRVGVITFISSFISKKGSRGYKYPVSDILIN